MECPRQWEQFKQTDEEWSLIWKPGMSPALKGRRRAKVRPAAWEIGAFCIVKNAIPNLVLARNTHCSSS